MKSIIKNLHWESSLEEDFIGICKGNNFPFTFVGHGDIVIEGSVPDFVDNDGSKKIIEVHHQFMKSYEDYRKELFSKYGFKTLFLYKKDFDKNLVVTKVKEFMEGR